MSVATATPVRRLALEPKSGIYKGLILGLFIPCNLIGLGLACVGLVMLGGPADAQKMARSFLMPGLAVMALAGIAMLVLVYKMWAAIQDGPASQTPGQAVGMLFMPFVNLVWQFFTFRGWMKEYNRYLDERNLDLPRMPVGLATTMCVFNVLCAIPILGVLFALVNFVIVICFINAACNGINRLAEVSQRD